MKKSSYSITHQSCLATSSFTISESSHNIQQQGTVMSEVNMYKQANIGKMIDLKPPCWCLSSNIGDMQLVMYDQHLSVASSYDKQCLFFCKKEITVITSKKVKVGKVVRKRICCTGSFIQILDSEDKFIYGVKAAKCQIGDWITNCLGWLRCGKPLNYEIIDVENKVVGTIEAYSDYFCNSRARYELNFPNQADTKSKILLVNSIALFN